MISCQHKIYKEGAILNTIRYGLTNARIEAINNKIKLSIRMAYGFRNIDNMMAMISGMCVELPWRWYLHFPFFFFLNSPEVVF